VRALSHSSFSAVLALDDMRLLLVGNLKVPLRAAALFSPVSIEKNVKQFCGELLDRCVPNHWKTTMRQCHLSLRDRFCIASSLFSVRKVVSSPKPKARAYVTKMSAPQSAPDPKFLGFCQRETRRIFKQGWDKGYWDQVATFTPPTKANISSTVDGTYRAQAVGNSASRDEFLRWSGGTVTSPIDTRVRAEAVLTGGKWRVITLSDPCLSRLLPLHRTIYNRLTKEKWLLRGEAVPSQFEGFGRVKGELFVSGDYEGATDNLNIHVSKCVLSSLLSSATHIPSRVREEAVASLRTTFVDKDFKVLGFHNRGQLMGSPLSFPLLCLINYLTFRYAVTREVPVKINGDDIVFRATPEERDLWFRLVETSGLKVSLGKTLVHSRCFSLNSSYFFSLDSGTAAIPHFRACAILRKCEDMRALAGRVVQVKRDLPVGEIRCSALKALVRRNFHVVYPSQGSFSRRYLCPLPGPVLRCLKLDDRESFYRGLSSEPAPLEPFCKSRQNVVSETKMTKESVLYACRRRVPEDEVGRRFTLAAWTVPIYGQTRDEYWARVRDRSYRYVPFESKTKRLYRKVFGKVYSPTHYPAFKNEKKFWVEERSEGPSGSVAFVSGGVSTF